jgi:signal transduction histidine kinase
MQASLKMRWMYVLALSGAGFVGVLLSWTAFGHQLDSDAYDFVFRLHEPKHWQTSSAILAIDEASLAAFGGVRGVRQALAQGLTKLAPAHPRVVAVDVILADATDEASDSALEVAFRQTQRLVLSCDLLPDGTEWDDPAPRFRRYAAAVGHVHADLDKFDGISRELPLERATATDRRWALAIEAFRVSREGSILETPNDLEVAGVTIPASFSSGRDLRIRYVPPSMEGIPHVSIKQLIDHPELAARFTGKVVFVGETAQTAVRDRWMTPYSNGIFMPGVEIHANAYETIAQRLFLTDVPLLWVLLWCAAMVLGAGLIFAFLSGAPANLLALALLLLAHAAPYLAFTRGLVFPFLPGVATAWLAIVVAAFWRHFVTRRYLSNAEAERGRYQQAMHFVTHEMRTPLTAIQGSSELMGRYNLPEEKSKQMAGMINAESKRLARMIETFLSVERLSAGQMELRQDEFAADEVVRTCLERVSPLAANKSIAMERAGSFDLLLSGDRELIEYAVYNLLTNAIKYSPPGTTVSVRGDLVKQGLCVSVQDQGIGMDKKEVRHVFEKFYRTERAQKSGEIGSGIGLSIVEQIVTQHGGSVGVVSEPGRGSTFTLVLPAHAAQIKR